jgi:hypothetical protein
VKRNTRYLFIYDDDINLFSLALNNNLQQDFFEPVAQNSPYEFEERNKQDINLRMDDIEKEEYLEIKCELIALMDNARHILNMNDDNPNALNWIKNVKSNWNGIQKMVEEVKIYQNKRTFQATWNRSNNTFWL